MNIALHFQHEFRFLTRSEITMVSYGALKYSPNLIFIDIRFLKHQKLENGELWRNEISIF